MSKKLALCSLVFSSSLFAADYIGYSSPQPEKHHLCTAAQLAMKNFEFMYMPGNRAACDEDKDCSFLHTEKWQHPQGINKTALAGYQLMLNDSSYKELLRAVDANCSPMHPMVIFPTPKSSKCIEKKCHPQASFEHDET